MSIQSGARRESWRQSGSRSTTGSGSVRRRQVVTTLLLIMLLLTAFVLVFLLWNRRYQHTRVAVLLTAAPTKTSEPEQPFTWPPLRFGSESLAPLTAENVEEFQVASLTASFDNVEDLQRNLFDQIEQLQRNDAFILWIRAKGAELNGQAYLLSGNYRLPESGEELDNPRGAVPFAAIVEAVSEWEGPVLICLDWGDQLCDPRAGVWDNQFLSLIAEEVRAAPSQVHCLVSHQAGELSLDSLTSRQTLFGRACAEGMVGPRRLPPGIRSAVWDSDRLLIGDLAEYVIRRVWIDSAYRQKPWLIQGQSGWLSANRQNWSNRTRLPLVKLNEQHRPLRWSLGTDDAGAAAAPDGTAAPAQPAEETASHELSDDAWPTAKLWQTLDLWRLPSADLNGWPLAAVAPLSAKRLATMVLELEQRWLAGIDFRGGVDGAGLLSKIGDLQLATQAAARDIKAAARQGDFSAVLAGAPSDVSAAEYANWQQRVASVAAYRQLALVLSEAVALSDNLARGDQAPNQLRQATASAIGNAKSWLQSVSTEAGESIDALRLSEAEMLTQEFRTRQAEIEARVDELVTRAQRNPHGERPLAEMLLRYCWLSHDQRRALLLGLLSPEKLEPDAPALTMDLDRLQPPAPQHRTAAQVLPPQRLELVQAAVPRDVGSGGSNISTPAQLVAVMSRWADSLNEGARISEAACLVIDGRDLCQQESGWSAQRQLPPLPAVPVPPAAWRLAWDKASGAQLNSDGLQLRSSSEAASVELVLSRVGAAEDIEAVQIELTGVEGRMRGNGQFQRGVLRLDRQELLRVVDLKADALRVTLELRAQSGDQQVSRDLQIQVLAGDNSPPPFKLACSIPPAVPVIITVQQYVRRDGVTAWEDCDRHEMLTTLTPFPGRKTQFRLLVFNQDQQLRTATVELYRLPSRSSTHAKGRISEVLGEVPSALEQQSIRAFSLIATSAPLALPPGSGGKQVDFSAAAESAAADTPATEATSGGGHDIAWGLLAAVRLDSEPLQVWKHWIQLRPVAAADFLTARSSVDSEARAIELEIGLKDANGDRVPDWTPTDFGDDQPIVLECAIGAGIDLQRVTFPMSRQVITKDKWQQVFSIRSDRRIESEVELQVTVDGAARALFEFVSVGGRAARREPPDRIVLRSVGVKDGLTYLSDFQRNLGENQRQLDGFGAMFQRPVAAPLEIVLAVDAESRGRIGALPEQVDFSLVGSTWDQTLGKFWGDRDLVATLGSAPTGILTIECQLNDWKFTFDARSLGDTEASFRGSIGRVNDQELAKLVLDGRGPELARAVRIEPVTQGQNALLNLEVLEAVPMGAGVIKVGPEGREAMAEPNGEKLTAADFVPASNGWQLSKRVLVVQDRAPGRYDVRVELTDRVGNTTGLGPWPLIIKAKPEVGGPGAAAAPPLRGDINGRLYWGMSTNRPPNPVTVKVKDMPNKTVTSRDGKFRIAGLEAGEYTLEATSEYQGVMHQGEAKIKLVTSSDYQKLIDISLSK